MQTPHKAAIQQQIEYNYEDEAGDIIYYDPYLNEWMPLTGGR